MSLKSIHNGVIKAYYQFSIEKPRSPSKLICVLMFIYQLQIGSLFVLPTIYVNPEAYRTAYADVDAAIEIVLSSVDIFRIWSYFASANALVFLMLVYYILLISAEVVHLILQNKRTHSQFWFIRLLSNLFLIQKYILLVPTLSECLRSIILGQPKAIIASTPTSNLALSSILLLITFMYNFVHANLAVNLPYSNGNLLESSYGYAFSDTISSLVLAILSKVIFKNFDFEAQELGLAGTLLIISAIMISLLRLSECVIFPRFESSTVQKLDIITQIFPLYTQTTLMVLRYKLPLLFIYLFLGKVAVNCHGLTITALLNVLKDETKQTEPIILDRALKCLLSYFNYIKYGKTFVSNVIEILNTEYQDFLLQVDIKNFKFHINDELRPFVMKLVDRKYRLAIDLQKSKKTKNFGLYISYIQFLTNFSCNYAKALFALNETRKVFLVQASSRQNILLDILSQKIAYRIKICKDNAVSSEIEEALQHTNTYQQNLVKAKSLTEERAKIICSIMNQVCDFDDLISKSSKFLKEAVHLKNHLSLSMSRTDNCYLEEVALLNFLQTNILESDQYKLMDKYIKAMKVKLNSKYEHIGYNKIFGLQTILNLSKNSSCSYICFSLLESKSTGLKVAAASSSLHNYLGITAQKSLIGLDARELFLSSTSYFLEGLSCSIRQGDLALQNKGRQWTEDYMYGVNKALFEVKYLPCINMVNQELFLTLYLVHGNNRSKVIIVDSKNKVIGLSKGLAEHFNSSSQQLRMTKLMNSKIQDLIPDFDLNLLTIQQDSYFSGTLYPHLTPSQYPILQSYSNLYTQKVNSTLR